MKNKEWLPEAMRSTAWGPDPYIRLMFTQKADVEEAVRSSVLMPVRSAVFREMSSAFFSDTFRLGTNEFTLLTRMYIASRVGEEWAPGGRLPNASANLV